MIAAKQMSLRKTSFWASLLYFALETMIEANKSNVVVQEKEAVKKDKVVKPEKPPVPTCWSCELALKSIFLESKQKWCIKHGEAVIENTPACKKGKHAHVRSN